MISSAQMVLHSQVARSRFAVDGRFDVVDNVDKVAWSVGTAEIEALFFMLSMSKKRNQDGVSTGCSRASFLGLVIRIDAKLLLTTMVKNCSCS